MENQLFDQSGYYKKLAVKSIVVIVALLFFTGAVVLGSRRDPYTYMDKKDSPNGIYELLVYDAAEFKDVLSPTDNRLVLRINRFGENLLEIYMEGKYRGITWANDNSKFLFCAKGGSCDFFIYDVLNNRCNEVGYILDSLFQKALESASLGFPLSDTGKRNYEFEQWSKDSQYLLFSFEMPDSSGVSRKGYFWYSCVTDGISGIQLV